MSDTSFHVSEDAYIVAVPALTTSLFPCLLLRRKGAQQESLRKVHEGPLRTWEKVAYLQTFGLSHGGSSGRPKGWAFSTTLHG